MCHLYAMKTVKCLAGAKENLDNWDQGNSKIDLNLRRLYLKLTQGS